MKFFENNHSLSLPKLFTAIALVFLAAWLLTPRFWEPGGESWKSWAAARILRETGGFPVFSRGPGYTVYLLLFQFLNYPLSMQVEYLVTHLFAYTAIFLMLNTILPYFFAFFFTCAWIPIIATTEGSAVVMGMGFFALYLRDSLYSDPITNKEYIPNSLLAAMLCHSVYLFFLIGNIFGTIIERFVKKQPFFSYLPMKNTKQILSFLCKSLLLLIIALTILSPSLRWDHNHMLTDAKYMPVPQENGLVAAFFQMGNWKYVANTVPESLWYKQDWYFTNKEAFRGATSIMQAIRNSPQLFVTILAENIKGLARLPREFITGSNFPKPVASSFTVLCLFLIPFGFFGLFRKLKNNINIALIFSSVLGVAAAISVFLLTSFNSRYVIALLPFALLLNTYIGTEVWNILIRLFKGSLKAYDGQVKPAILFMTISSILILVSTPYPHGKTEQIKAVLSNRALLSKDDPPRIDCLYKELGLDLDKNISILAIEDHWFKGFSKINLDNIYNVMTLPPFPDSSGETERLLNSIDVICVNSYWSTKGYSQATQSYLRYELHIEPFLKKALTRGWIVEDVWGYGKIYHKPFVK